MSFHFVDQSDINNKKERKLIRSHVMKGKNIGKKRLKKTQHSESTTNKSVILHGAGVGNESTSTTTLERLQCDDASILAVTRQIANDLSLLPSTREISPQTMFHIRQMSSYILDISCPREFCQSTGVTEWIWFQLTFYNKAYFHCTVAIASACAAFLTGDSYHSPVALCHMSEAYRLVNKTLSSSEPLSDTTVAVVAAINIYDRLYGDPQKAMVHLNGLAGLITLRGGISELAERNIVIAEKAFRSDIELALSCGTTPKFSSRHVPRRLILTDSRGCLEPRQNGEAEALKSILYHSVSAGLRDVVLEILRFSHLLNQASRARKLDSVAYQGTLLYVGYRLLEIKHPRYDSDADTDFDTLVQLALTGFQNTFCFGMGRKIMAFPLVMERFRSVAQTIRRDNRSQQMVIFWALLVGRVSALTRDDDVWLILKLKALANELELQSWPEVSNALRQFPWVNAMHEAQGEEFWNKKLAHAIPLESTLVE
ncbi:hypothetical protein F5Y09DRAFT_315168 [Xylaria sp. FL1042]|nr:hypothetical protein F5Y09DRAFT_315168 [Xylaria sp. FL1042]